MDVEFNFCFFFSLKDNVKSDAKLVKSSIWGPTCDGIDVVLKNYMMPEIEIGDSMAFKNMGAYTIAGACPFNGIPIAKCLYTASDRLMAIENDFESFDERKKSIEEFLCDEVMTHTLYHQYSTCANEFNNIEATLALAPIDDMEDNILC